jgi:hypothetical protein
MRKVASTLTILVLVLLIGSPAQVQVGQSPKQTLSPELYRSMRGSDSDKLDTVIRQQEIFSYQHTKMMEKIDSLIPTISRNTQHLEAIDQQMAAEQTARRELQAQLDQHVSGQVNQPISIAVLTAQLDTVRSVGIWILTGVGGLLLGLIAFAGKAFISKNLPPAWAATQSIQVAERLQEHEKAQKELLREHDQRQEEYRNHVLGGLQEVKQVVNEAGNRADKAFLESNNVNLKLVAIGAQVRDGKPLKQE